MGTEINGEKRKEKWERRNRKIQKGDGKTCLINSEKNTGQR